LTRCIKIDKVGRYLREEKHMAKASPIGTAASEAKRRRARRSPAYRAEQQRLAQFEEFARMVIKHRAARGLSQEELARLVGTSHSAISRIESGRHKTSVDTLQRIAQALGLRLVLGFESGPPGSRVRELITT
jgi:ribosome-binding protein aMBF1 (putative translation factor)